MVRGSYNQKSQITNSSISPMKPKQRKRLKGNLSHSPSKSKKSFLKFESISSHSSQPEIMKSSPVAENPITNYYSYQINERKSLENSPVSITAIHDSNAESKNLISVQFNSNKLQEPNERLENRIEENCSINSKEINKTESCVPFSPSTALSQLDVNSPKKLSKVRRCLIRQDDVLKTNNQKLNAKVLKDSGNSTNPQTKLTEFFPVRRSVRKTEKTVLEEKRKTLVEAIVSNKEDGLAIRIFEGKGRGVVATRKFYKGEFVVEYAGELITMEEAQKREAMYSRNENIGCYMYYFKHRNQQHCIDATAETKRLGRLLNHSRFGNLSTKTVDVNGIPRLILIAKEDIEPNSELTYDYGDRSKLSLQYHPWLAQ